MIESVTLEPASRKPDEGVTVMPVPACAAADQLPTPMPVFVSPTVSVPPALGKVRSVGEATIDDVQLRLWEPQELTPRPTPQPIAKRDATESTNR